MMQLGIGGQATVDQVITQQAEFLHGEGCLAAKGGLYAAYNKCSSSRRHMVAANRDNRHAPDRNLHRAPLAACLARQ